MIRTCSNYVQILLLSQVFFFLPLSERGLQLIYTIWVLWNEFLHTADKMYLLFQTTSFGAKQKQKQKQKNKKRLSNQLRYCKVVKGRNCVHGTKKKTRLNGDPRPPNLEVQQIGPMFLEKEKKPTRQRNTLSSSRQQKGKGSHNEATSIQPDLWSQDDRSELLD